MRTPGQFSRSCTQSSKPQSTNGLLKPSSDTILRAQRLAPAFNEIVGFETGACRQAEYILGDAAAGLQPVFVKAGYFGANTRWSAQMGRCNGLSYSPTVTFPKCMESG